MAKLTEFLIFAVPMNYFAEEEEPILLPPPTKEIPPIPMNRADWKRWWALAKEYVKTREFWQVMAFVFLNYLLAMFIVFYIALPVFTGHKDYIQVPNLQGKSLEQATEILQAKGLNVEVSDSQYTDSLPPLAVLNQEPPSMSKVKDGRTIYLIVNRLTPPLVSFPDFKDLSWNDFQNRLKHLKFTIGEVKKTPGRDDKVLEVFVNGKSISPQMKVPQGSKVDVVIEELVDFEVEVPDLTGMTLGEANAKLTEVHLRIAGKRYNPASKEPEGTIYRQNPKPGTIVRQGNDVDLFISGPEPKETSE